MQFAIFLVLQNILKECELKYNIKNLSKNNDGSRGGLIFEATHGTTKSIVGLRFLYTRSREKFYARKKCRIVRDVERTTFFWKKIYIYKQKKKTFKHPSIVT